MVFHLHEYPIDTGGLQVCVWYVTVTVDLSVSQPDPQSPVVQSVVSESLIAWVNEPRIGSAHNSFAWAVAEAEIK